MDMEEIRVSVPTERVTDFYRWFADWRDGAQSPSLSGTSKSDPTGGATPAAQTLSAAIDWWNSLKSSERGIWGLWIDAAPSMISADTIVHELGLKGGRDIPGILSWSGRKGYKVGFTVAWRFRNDPETGEPLYGIEDAAYAALLREARDTVAQR
jgi:hypothetical protein